LQYMPLWGAVFLTRLRTLVLHVALPLFDVVSDFAAGYLYRDKKAYLITGLILLFVLLPHIVLSIVLISEMTIDVGEFDEYPKFIVRFYKSKPTPFRIVNHVIKFLTLPVLVILNFVWFLASLIWFGLVLVQKIVVSLYADSRKRVGHRHPEDLRLKNVKEESGSKNIILELVFESIPQLLTQTTAAVTVWKTNPLKSFPIMSSIVMSALNLAHQSWVIIGFMKTTHMTYWNTMRYMLSSSLDFFPLLNLYRNGTEHVLIQFYDSSVLLELWGALCDLLKKNTSLKALTLYLEDVYDWMDMSLDVMEAILANERLALDFLEVYVETDNAEEAKAVVARMDVFKEKF